MNNPALFRFLRYVQRVFAGFVRKFRIFYKKMTGNTEKYRKNYPAGSVLGSIQYD